LKTYPSWVNGLEILNQVNCDCREEWRREVRAIISPLKTRITEGYELLAEELKIDRSLIPYGLINKNVYNTNSDTIVFIKPDAFKRNLNRAIEDILIKRGLHIRSRKTMHADAQFIAKIYPTMYGEDYIQEITEYYAEGTLEVLLCSGKNAIQVALDARNEIRKEFAESKLRNLIHAVDSEGEFIYQKMEIFPETGAFYDL
jgi:nucleoside diphosphate kinase